MGSIPFDPVAGAAWLNDSYSLLLKIKQQVDLEQARRHKRRPLKIAIVPRTKEKPSDRVA
jgi:hypothetical protein